jgi:hypothetical protein
LKAALVFVASVGLLLGAATASSAGIVTVPSSPTSTTHLEQPYVLRNDDGTVPAAGSLVGPGGNVQCQQVGTFDYASDRTDYDPDEPGTSFTVLVLDSLGEVKGTVAVTYNTVAKLLDFDATVPIEVVIVKGGQDANIYDYRTDGVMSDTGLGAPVNASGVVAALGNITVCSNPHEDPPPSNWCSPGYWRNHLAAWTSTGISGSALYTSYFEASTLSKKAGVSNPTLSQVVQSPQTYGGAAFNNVGDLLSDNHPGVNWSPGDERTEDSCPLS